MTARAASLRSRRAGHVLRVIEFDVECFVETGGKVFEWRVVAVDFCVTDLAHRHLRCRELAAVTVSACFVTRKAWRCRVVDALVTGVAGKGTVLLARVQELRVVELRALCRRRSEKKKSCQKELHLMSLRFNGGRCATT